MTHMHAINSLTINSFTIRMLAHALGWTLLHFLWQGTLVALCFRCALALLRGRSARVRYAAGCAAMAAMMLLPMATFAYLVATARQGTAPIDASRLVWRGVEGSGASAGSIAVPLSARVASMLDRCVPGVVAFWVLGFVLLQGRLIMGLAAVRRMKLTGVEAPQELRELVRQLCLRMGVKRVVRLLQSAVVDAPTVIGWLQPVILLPLTALTGMSAAQVEVLLAHELAHVCRHDYFVSVLQSFVETVLFYHPAVWWISREMRREREFCCDDAAVAVSGDALAYARALSLLEERRGSNLKLALNANGGVLTMRIKRMLGYEEKQGVSQAAAVGLVVLLLLSGTGLAARAVQPRTVKPIVGGTSMGHTQPAAFATNLPAVVKLVRTTDVRLAAKVVAAATPKPQKGGTMSEAYQKWLDEDVLWIITPEERAAYVSLPTDQERDHFIEQFWLRRDGKDEPAYSYRTENYQRLAYANIHFASSVPGWRTDRGHVYIVYGKPDAIDSHSNLAVPYETWHYANLRGESVDFKFVDDCQCGEFRLDRASTD